VVLPNLKSGSLVNSGRGIGFSAAFPVVNLNDYPILCVLGDDKPVPFVLPFPGSIN
jgi:hypothetical protein